ncbi:MAG: YiiX/YebB-like N1pC/P60 family cysteine hydrolase [Pseudomonadota bacterium]
MGPHDAKAIPTVPVALHAPHDVVSYGEPASFSHAEPGATTATSLRADIAHWTGVLSAPVTNADGLYDNLTAVYQALMLADLKRYEPERVAHEAPELLQDVFQMRLALRDQIAGWERRGLMSVPVQKAMRAVFRASRYTADMIGEVMIGFARINEDDEPYKGFTGGAGYTLFAPPFANPRGLLTFKSGDVLLMRGLAHNSAAIARIGDVDSQFSHVGMVYVDDGGRPFIVESLIETGATISPLHKTLENGLVRAVLFRHHDEGLADRAARWIHQFVRDSLDGKRPRVHYDFQMRMDNQDELFCSELVRYAYAEASKGALILPTFMTQFDMQNRDFLHRIGVEVDHAFAPGDIEMEPSFQVVAEWRDYRATWNLRIKDMVMDKLFEWMDAYDMRFRETFITRLIGWFGRVASYLSPGAKRLIEDVIPQVPKNMTRRQIATVAMLHATAQPVFEMLRDIDQQEVQRTGRPLHPRVYREELERMRREGAGRLGYLRGRVH